MSELSSSHLVRKITLSIIKSIGSKKIVPDKRTVIHADLVPKFSSRIFKASMGEKIIPSWRKKEEEVKEIIGELEKPLETSKLLITKQEKELPKIRPQQITNSRMPPRLQNQNYLEAPGVNLGKSGFVKLAPLLRDSSVFSIECPGAGKALTVNRTGQKQITRVVLTEGEIKNILEKISEEVHIPLIEGVFRAALDDFQVSAVISKVLGSKFVLKKPIPGVGHF